LFHLLMLAAVGAESEGGPYHWFVTGLVAAWACGAWACQRLARRPGWAAATPFLWCGLDVALFTLLLVGRAPRPGGSLVDGLLVLPAAAALRSRVALVWFVSALSLAGYFFLAVHARLALPGVAVEPSRCFRFVLFLGVMAVVLHLLVRRGRAEALAVGRE